MQTLSYGYFKPETGDRGTTLFTALEDNIQRLNDHNHDGNNSSLLPAQNIQASSQTILAAAWDGTGLPTGHYRQLVTVVAGFTFDGTNIGFRVSGNSGSYIYPTVERVTNTTFYVYTTDNTLDFVAIYK